MVVWGGSTVCCPIDSVIHDDDAAAYSPATNSWRSLPAVPRPWSGDGGPAVVERLGADLVVWRAGHLGRMDGPTGAWRDLGSRPPRARGCMMTGGPKGAAALVGSRVHAWVGHCSLDEGSIYDLDTATWSDGAAAPPGLASVHAAGTRVFGRVQGSGDGASAPSLIELDTGTQRWLAPSAVPPAAYAWSAITWTGSELLLWGGSGERHRSGATYRP